MGYTSLSARYYDDEYVATLVVSLLGFLALPILLFFMFFLTLRG